MEGVAFHVRWIIEAMENVGFDIGDLQAIGGGNASPLWTQIIADITGRSLRRRAPARGRRHGRGSAVAVGLGIYPEMDAVDDLIKVRPSSNLSDPKPGVYERMYLISATSTPPWPRSTRPPRRTPESSLALFSC